MTKKLPPQIVNKEPDIAFWFDGEGRYLVKIRQDIPYQDLVLACMDLFTKAIHLNDETEWASWTEEHNEDDE